RRTEEELNHGQEISTTDHTVAMRWSPRRSYRLVGCGLIIPVRLGRFLETDLPFGLGCVRGNWAIALGHAEHPSNSKRMTTPPVLRLGNTLTVRSDFVPPLHTRYVRTRYSTVGTVPSSRSAEPSSGKLLR